jgi:hypothetical protein
MYIKDLLVLIGMNYGDGFFTTNDVSCMLQETARAWPMTRLVDNPKGLTTKWVSNDLKRLHLMGLLNRKREKRPVGGLIALCNRGYHYTYHISRNGATYLQKLQKQRFSLESKIYQSNKDQAIQSRQIEEMAFFLAENPQSSEEQKAATRQAIRTMMSLSQGDGNIDYGLFQIAGDQQMPYLAGKDREQRKKLGLERRFRMYQELTNKDEEIADKDRQILLLQEKIEFLEKRRSLEQQNRNPIQT